MKFHSIPSNLYSSYYTENYRTQGCIYTNVQINLEIKIINNYLFQYEHGVVEQLL